MNPHENIFGKEAERFTKDSPAADYSLYGALEKPGALDEANRDSIRAVNELRVIYETNWTDTDPDSPKGRVEERRMKEGLVELKKLRLVANL